MDEEERWGGGGELGVRTSKVCHFFPAGVMMAPVSMGGLEAQAHSQEGPLLLTLSLTSAFLSWLYGQPSHLHPLPPG